MWIVDLLIALVVTAVEAGVVFLLWLAAGIKGWAAQGRKTPRLDRNINIGLVGVAALPAAAAFGLFRVDLPITAAAQCLMAAPPALVLVLHPAELLWRRFRHFRSGRPGGS